MADEKWIDELRSDMPVSAAAKLALERRLGAVRERLPDAVFFADDDVEHVHHLRVSTRRAAAALRIFADALPARLHEKTRKTLRALRRSAGEARDWDVFLTEIQRRLARASTAHRPGLTFLLGFGESQRIAAQEHLKEAHDAKAEKFTTCIEEVSAELDKASPQDKTLRDLAGVVVGELLRDLESAAAADLQSYEALHQLRILGKKLRYAMELFESCFASEFRERFYPAIVEMQDILGLANDSYTAAERLKSIRARLVDSHLKGWPKLEPGIEALIAFHEKRLPQQRKKFEKWWRAWMKSGAEQAFAELIRTKSE